MKKFYLYQNNVKILKLFFSSDKFRMGDPN